MVHTTQFLEFQANFKARLDRIAAAAKDSPALLPGLKKALNDLALPNIWDGAYAELVVFDFLIADKRTSAGSLELDVTVPATETLASEMGHTNANLDVRLNRFDVYLDTKLLSDKSGAILDGIIRQVLKAKGIKMMTVLPAFNTDLPFEDFEKNGPGLYTELMALMDVKVRPRHVQSTIIPTLTYEFAWDPGILMGVAKTIRRLTG